MADDTPEAAGLDGQLRTLTALEGAADRFGSALTQGFKAATLEGRSFDAVLQTVLRRLSSAALDAALAPLSSLLGGLAGNVVGSIGSGLGSLMGRITPFADGGVVASPTYFPLGGGAGLAGEAGAEAILPLARGPDGRMGVRGEGGSMQVTFNVQTPDAASFRRSEAQITGMLARAVGRGRRGL